MSAGNGALAGRVACVTGASRGIGCAITAALVDEGADVVMLARDPDVLARAAADLGDHAHPISTDVSDPEAVRAAFKEIASTHGRLDVLVNNAGTSPLRRIENLSDDEILTTVGCNLLGAVYTTREAIPLMRAAGRGDIVNISSESSSMPFPFLGLYAASKAGLETFSKAALVELKPLGVRVTTLVCGATADTEWSRDWDTDEMARFFEAATASGHLAMVSAGAPQQPEDVADVVRFVVTRPPGQMIDVIHARSHSAVDPANMVDQMLDRP
jgi:NAD(P)-dependent dehydrogenase (short-subunit alcohol dehydrogenase family)